MSDVYFVGDYGFSITLETGQDLTESGLSFEVQVSRPDAFPAVVIEDDGGTFTEHTSGSQTEGSSFTILPDEPAANDAVYIGARFRFTNLLINVTTAGVGSWSITWEYWNGSSWSSASVTDGTDGFKTRGKNNVSWTVPSDWTKTWVDGKGGYYYLRARLDTGDANPTTLPEVETVRIDHDSISATLNDGQDGLVDFDVPEGLFDESGHYKAQVISTKSGLQRRSPYTTLNVKEHFSY